MTTTTTATDTFNSLGLATATKATGAQKQTLGQDQFLKLLTTQMTHQDPMKPMDNGEFLGQMAQFSTVSGIQDLQASFKSFAESISSNQALQAAGLVGRYVLAPGSSGLLSAGGNVSGTYDLTTSSPNVTLQVTNAKTGEVVRQVDLGQQATGTNQFQWDGKDNKGQLANPGVYKIGVFGLVDGKNTAIATNIYSQVDSLTMANGSNPMKVNLLGLGSVNFSQIKEIL